MQPTFPARPKRSRRRQCLRAVGGLGAGASGVRLAQAGELPRNTEPRAISGDPVEPDWKQPVTIMVGPKDADPVATTDRVIKAAVDYVAEAVPCGSCRAPTGCTTPSVSSREPASWGARPTRCYSWSRRPPPDSSWTAITGIRRSRRPIPAGFAWETVSVSSPRIRTARARTSSSERSSPPRAIASSSTGAWRSGSTSRGPRIATIFALLRCTNVSDVTIENVTGDGNKAYNEMIDQGAFDDGSIRLDDCNRVTVRGVTVRDFYCDGIVWGISHDVVVEQCDLHDGVRLALHSGSGSQRSIVRGNRVRRSAEGIYFCWGAQHGLYEKNVIEDCNYGMTLGHSDSDNLIRDNDIRWSGQAGIHFRGGNKAFAPHRNRFERNRIVDSGGEKGVAIDINGETESVTVIRNELRETRASLSRIGILIGAETRDIRCAENRIEGFAIAISDRHKG